MKVLITGANGLLGQKLVKYYQNQPEIELIATARGENRNPSKEGYHYAEMDITDETQILSVFNEFKPDALIHGAAMTQVDTCESEKEKCTLHNVTSVKYLMEACKQHHSHFVFVSTDFVFDGENGPYKEDDLPNPVSFYGNSKWEAEKLLQASDLKYAIIRTMLVYGVVPDMSRSNIILWVKKSLEDKKNIRVVNDQWRMPTLAEDLAKGCALVAEKKAEGIYHISGKDMLTPYDIAIATADFFKLDKSLMEEVDASVFSQPAKRPPKTGFILDKAINKLGYNPLSFTEGLAVMAKQLQKIKH